MNTAIIPVIIEQHAEEAAFLWILRDAAVKAPHYRLKDLGKLDGRVEAHLDGLRIAGSEGWRICADALDTGEAGEAFAAGVLALESRDWQRLDAVLQAVEKFPESVRGLISAFGWVAPRHLSGVVRTLLDSPSSLHRLIAIRACAIHRADPGPLVSEVISQPGQPQELLAAALRTAGELRRRDLWPMVRRHLQSPEVAVRFWATWASVLLGDRGEGVECLKAMVVTESSLQLRALGLALRVMPLESAHQWLKGFSQYQQWQHPLVIGVGIVGDPAYVPWLIKQMEAPALARAAGEALSLITGVDLAYEDLDGDKPENFESGPTENPDDENVAMDDEEDLPLARSAEGGELVAANEITLYFRGEASGGSAGHGIAVSTNSGRGLSATAQRRCRGIGFDRSGAAFVRNACSRLATTRHVQSA